VKKPLFLAGLILIMAAVIAGCGGGKQPGATAEPVKLTVSAAASLTDALGELKTIYEKQRDNVIITYNFGASGPLQKQIEEGAPVDLFISAGKSQMDTLAGKGLIHEESRKDLLGNELVLIAGKDSSLSGFDGLAGADVSKIAVGVPESAPAGMYARETLTAMKLWDKVQPKLVLAKDVRQVLRYVETGNVDAGLVYRSDAMTSDKVKVVAAAPDDSHKPIVYPMAVIKSTKHQKEAGDFTSFLQGGEASRVFGKYGFKTMGTR